jgi:hypothetical protein
MKLPLTAEWIPPDGGEAEDRGADQNEWGTAAPAIFAISPEEPQNHDQGTDEDQKHEEAILKKKTNRLEL